MVTLGVGYTFVDPPLNPPRDPFPPFSASRRLTVSPWGTLGIQCCQGCLSCTSASWFYIELSSLERNLATIQTVSQSPRQMYPAFQATQGLHVVRKTPSV